MIHKGLECVVAGSDILGEVPVWCDRTNQLWWIDGRRPSLQSYDPVSGKHETFLVPAPHVGCVALRERGGFVMALEDSVYAFDTASKSLDLLVLVEPGMPQNHLNDGRCDRRGRFWIGSMNAPPKNPEGTCYRIDPDLSVNAMFNEVINTNGIAFSPDDKTFYFADNRRAIYAFDLDIDTGMLSNRRVFADIQGSRGRPDGSTVDADGCLWSAEFRGGRVVRYTPDGRIDRVLELPVTNPTSCAFGGKNLNTLFITTGTVYMTAQQRKEQPLAGGLFACDAGVRGVAEPRFAG